MIQWLKKFFTQPEAVNDIEGEAIMRCLQTGKMVIADIDNQGKVTFTECDLENKQQKEESEHQKLYINSTS